MRELGNHLARLRRVPQLGTVFERRDRILAGNGAEAES